MVYEGMRGIERIVVMGIINRKESVAGWKDANKTTRMSKSEAVVKVHAINISSCSQMFGEPTSIESVDN